MTFDQWMKLNNTQYRTNDDTVALRLLRRTWDAAFRDGYEKGVAAFHEAVRIEREACAVAAEDDANIDRDPFATQSNCAAAIRARSNAGHEAD